MTEPIVLDSGRTALALRARHEREGHYPFVAPRWERRHRRAERQAWRRQLAARAAEIQATHPVLAEIPRCLAFFLYGALGLAALVFVVRWIP